MTQSRRSLSLISLNRAAIVCRQISDCMRRVRYCLAVSLDGFIAGPNGEADWIVMEEEVDFVSFFKQFDTVLMGRKTYDVAQKGMGAEMPGMHTIAFSRTIPPAASKVEFVNDAVKTVSDLKAKPGKDMWLFGGGQLFRSLLDAKLVDTIEVGIMPILLSE